MAIKYPPVGPPGDQVQCSVQVDDVDLGAGNRTDLHVTLERVAGGATAVDCFVLLWNTSAGATPTIDPPGTIFFGILSVGSQAGIPLAANQATDVHFLIDNPAGGAAIATYSITPILIWPANFHFLGPTPHTALTKTE